MVRRNKYNNKKTEYNGNIYDSKLEASYAQELDMRQRGGDILRWSGQFKMPIVVKGQKIGFYKADFLVTYSDGMEEIVEVKGMWTALAKWKFKIVKALYPQFKYTVITKDYFKK